MPYTLADIDAEIKRRENESLLGRSEPLVARGLEMEEADAQEPTEAYSIKDIGAGAARREEGVAPAETPPQDELGADKPASGGYLLEDIEREIARREGRTYQPAPSSGGGFAADIHGGLVDLGEMYGRWIRAMPGGEAAGGYGDGEIGAGGEIIRKAEEYKERKGLDKERTGLSRWTHEGVRAVTTSLAAGLPTAAAGFFLGGPVGAVVGFGLGAGTTFGIAEFDSSLEEAKQAGIPLDKAIEPAIRNGVYEGGFELAGDLLSLYTLGATKLVSPIAKEALQGGIKALFKTGWKQALKRGAGATAIETGTELLTAGFQTEERRALGLTQQTFMDGVSEAFGPAFVASLIFVGISGGAIKLNRKKAINTLEDGNADPKQRRAVAKAVYDTLKEVDPVMAASWQKNSLKAIANKESIPTSDITPTDEKLENSIEQRNADVEGEVKARFKEILDSGLKTGVDPEGKPFTKESAVSMIRLGHKQGVIDTAELETLKTQWPDLTNEITVILLGNKISDTVTPRVEKTPEQIQSEVIRSIEDKLLDDESLQAESIDSRLEDETSQAGYAETEVKPQESTPVTIPEFENTDQALEFGKTATPEQITELKRFREESLKKSRELGSKGKTQEALDEAVRGQLFREAVEASETGEAQGTEDILKGIEAPQPEQPPALQAAEKRGVKDDALSDKATQAGGPAPETGKQEEPKIFKGKNVDVVVSPSPKKPGKWQVSMIDKKGVPNGDTQHDTYEEAVEAGKYEAGIVTPEEERAYQELIGTKVEPQAPPEVTPELRATEAPAPTEEESIKEIIESPKATQAEVKAEKRKLKGQIIDGIQTGVYTGAVRFGTVDEIKTSLKTGKLPVSEEYGEAHAQPITGKDDDAFAAYGAYNKHNMAMVIPEKYIVEKVDAHTKEVTIDPEVPLNEITYLIDGHEKAYTFDELQDAVGEEKAPTEKIEKEPVAKAKPEITAKVEVAPKKPVQIEQEKPVVAPKPQPIPQATRASIDVTSLPTETVTVKSKAIRESTGEVVIIEDTAKDVLEDNSKSMESYLSILECLK